MPKFVIERGVPGAGSWNAEERQGAAQKSCDVLLAMGPEIQWLESYVIDDKIYCVYYAPDMDAVREHARKSGFPADKIGQIRYMLEPLTAEGAPPVR